jgi:hypothetical protein
MLKNAKETGSVVMEMDIRLVKILRECIRVKEAKKLNDLEWLEECGCLVHGPLRVLDFLDLVESDSSKLNWRPKRRLMYLAKRPVKTGPRGIRRTDNDLLLIDMLNGIATGGEFDNYDGPDVDNTCCYNVKIITTCIASVLVRLNLVQFNDYGMGPVWRATPLLLKLFKQGALELEKAYRR